MKSSVNLSDLSALVVLRRWGEKPSLLLSKRRWGELERVASRQSSVVSQVVGKFTADHRPPTADCKFLAPTARDWPNITCSENSDIKQNRHKHRWKDYRHLLKDSRRGEVCMAVEDWRIGRLEDWEIGGLGDWKIGGLGDWKIGRLDSGTVELWNLGTLEQ